MIKIEALAYKVGVSVQTIRNYYSWKASNPDNELAAILPEPIVVRAGKVRRLYWNDDDHEAVSEFKKHIVRGCRGVMGKKGSNNEQWR